MLSLRKNLFLSVVLLLSSESMAFNMNQQSVKNLFVTYGYLYAQELILNKIENTYPELKYDVANVRARFNLTFPNITNKTKGLIFSINEKNVGKEFNDLESGVDSKVNVLINNISKEEAVRFLNTINERAKGNVDSPILENLLSIQYENNPQKEMKDGFAKAYSSLGSYKSKEVEVSIKTPISWKEEEAERPNIVKKWISQNGTGLDNIMLMVKDAQGLSPSFYEVQDMYKNGGLEDWVPDGFKIIDKGSPIVLDGENGFRFVLGGEAQRLDKTIYTQMDMYMIFYKGKIVSLQCGSAGLVKDKTAINFNFPKIKDLCSSVANTLTLPQKYR